MVDYLIVGLGLAGISFCETLEKNGKTFKVISDNSQTSSQVAGGMYNPVILNRFTLAWKANEQIEMAGPFYTDLEKKLDVKLNYKLPILRRFRSAEDQNAWFEASDKLGISQFISEKILPNKNLRIEAELGYGMVLKTGRIDTETLISYYKKYLTDKGLFESETFEYDLVNTSQSEISYKSIRAKQIIFTEGYGLNHNPFFNYLPLKGTKGELLTIKAPLLKEENIIKSSVFIIPLGNDFYRIGATYKWKDKTNTPTEPAKDELLKKLDSFLNCEYEIVDHRAGIRPTVTDRRPLVGRHPKHKNLYVLNGLGSRGVMIGPYASKQLFDFIENQIPIDEEMNIERFNIKREEKSRTA